MVPAMKPTRAIKHLGFFLILTATFSPMFSSGDVCNDDLTSVDWEIPAAQAAIEPIRQNLLAMGHSNEIIEETLERAEKPCIATIPIKVVNSLKANQRLTAAQYRRWGKSIYSRNSISCLPQLMEFAAFEPERFVN